MGDEYEFPDDWKEYLEDYSKIDTEQPLGKSKMISVVRVEQMIEHYFEEKKRVMYLCDGRACDGICGDWDHCRHTTDIEHAKNFERVGYIYVEQERIYGTDSINEETE